MARISLLLCLLSLIALFGAILDGASAHTNLTKAVPHSAKDIEAYTMNEVMSFVTELEKSCPVRKEFKVFFQRLKDYTKMACPVSSMAGEKSLKINKTEMDLRARKLFHAMVALHAGKVDSGPTRNALRQKQMEAIKKFKALQSAIQNIVVERDTKKNGSMTLTAEQQKTVEVSVLEAERGIKQLVKVAVQGELKISVHLLLKD